MLKCFACNTQKAITRVKNVLKPGTCDQLYFIKLVYTYKLLTTGPILWNVEQFGYRDFASEKPAQNEICGCPDLL